jgi:hypothetical protein
MNLSMTIQDKTKDKPEGFIFQKIDNIYIVSNQLPTCRKVIIRVHEERSGVVTHAAPDIHGTKATVKSGCYST